MKLLQVIKEIRIENFQSHQNTTLKFSSGLNIITGPSDNGKSAIIRALRWVLYNEPLGDDFIRVGSSQCRVGILLGNDYRVIRERSSNKNRYIVVDPEGEREVYTGFGTKVPLEVTEAHQMPKVTLDDDLKTTLNLDYQLVGPFLLNDSGSTRAKAIGQLTGVHIIDGAIKDVAIDLRRKKSEKKKELNEIERIDKKLAGYQDLPKLKEEIDKKDELLKQLKKVKTKLDKYCNLKQNWEELEKEKNNLQKVLNELTKLEKVEKLHQKIIKKKQKLSNLKKLKNDWQKVVENINELKQKLKKLDNLAKVETYYQKLNNLYQKRLELSNYKEQLNKLNLEIKQGKRVLQQTKNLAKTNKLLKEISTKKERYIELKNINQEWQKINKELTQRQKVLVKFPANEKMQQLLTKIKKTKDRLNKLKEIKIDYKENQKNIQKGEKCIKQIDQQIETKLEIYKTKLRELNRCPVCFSQIEDKILERIIDNYKLGGGN